MNTTQTTALRPHIVWLDTLRFVAILMVVACHCTDPFNASPESRANPDFSYWGSFYGSMLRACVPLFVMMTGFLLLPVKQEAATFYKKRIPRVFFPFLLWSILFNLSPWFIQWMGGSPDLVTTFFPYAPDPSASLADVLKDIAMIPLNFTVYATPMWYIYALIGLYLYMPVFSAWIEKASENAKRWFLAAWCFTLFIPYLMEFVTHYLLGTCSWNAYGLFYYFAGFNGYLLLGHYLGKGNNWSVGKTLLITIPMFLVGYGVTLVGFRHMIAIPDVSEEGVELFFTYCSPNTVLMTAAIFLLVQKIRITSSFIRRSLAFLTTCGFGIYVSHYFFVGPAYLLAKWLGTPISLLVPVSAIFAFIGAWALVALLSKLPKSKYIIG